MTKMWLLRSVLTVGFFVAANAPAQEIHLKTRTLATAQRNTDSRTPVFSRGRERTMHQIVQFAHAPGVDEMAALAEAGAEIVNSLPDNALVVSMPSGTRIRGVVWSGRMEASDKISPALSRHSGTSPVIVEFHSDITAEQQAAVEASLGATFSRPAGLMTKHVIMQATAAERRVLAEQDEVAYIFPASPEMLNGTYTYPCAGMLTTTGSVAQYANVMQGWELNQDGFAHLGYYFGSLTTKVSAATVQSEILRAMNQWTSVANVTFEPSAIASATRSIYIEFVSGSHGDAYPFDGPGGMLAHTFYPAPSNAEPIAGDLHFDADEAWKAGGDTDIYTVALHELGHALGLTHTDNPGDVMYPYYQRGMALSANDIGAARQLYPQSTEPVKPITNSQVPAGLTLTLDPIATSTSASAIGLSGMVTGGTGADWVQWQTNHGVTGTATVSEMGAWTATGIPLVAGPNTLTVSAKDAASQTVTRTASVTMQTPATTTISASLPVKISIAAPTSAVVTVNATALTVSGSASSGAGITKITWTTTSGATGVATGTSTWVASNIPLLQGTNTIIVRAYDAKGTSAWMATVAVRP